MLPSYWGPPAWILLHAITLDYPLEPTELDKEHYKTFFLLLQYVLPCQDCSNHFVKNLLINPLSKALESRNNFVIWLIKMHNIVNEQTNKPILPIREALKLIQARQQNAMTYYWEEPGWIFLHAITIEYPVKPNDIEKETRRLFFDTLQYVLPSQEYRNFYKQSLDNELLTPEILSSQTQMVKWANDMHNNINSFRGLPILSAKTRILNIITDHSKIQQIKHEEINENYNKNIAGNKTLMLLCSIIMIIVIVTIIAYVTRNSIADMYA